MAEMTREEMLRRAQWAERLRKQQPFGPEYQSQFAPVVSSAPASMVEAEPRNPVSLPTSTQGDGPAVSIPSVTPTPTVTAPGQPSPALDFDPSDELARLKRQQILMARMAQQQGAAQGLGRQEQILLGQQAVTQNREQQNEVRRMLAARQGLRNQEAANALSPNDRIAAAAALDDQLPGAQSAMLDQAGMDLERRRQLAQLYPSARTAADLAAVEQEIVDRTAPAISPQLGQFEQRAREVPIRSQQEINADMIRRRALLEQTTQPVAVRVQQERADAAMEVERQRQLRQSQFEAQTRILDQQGRLEAGPIERTIKDFGSLPPGEREAAIADWMRANGFTTSRVRASGQAVQDNPDLQLMVGQISSAVGAFVADPRNKSNRDTAARAVARLDTLDPASRKAVLDTIKAQVLAANPDVVNALDQDMSGNVLEIASRFIGPRLPQTIWGWVFSNDNPFTRDVHANRTVEIIRASLGI